jgi:RNA polymerase sigma-70 factor, ECF subfamily
MDKPEFPDQELFRIAESNDEEFLKILFRLYYSRLCSYALTLVKDTDLAEDIVQETFIKFWEYREEIKIAHSVRSYIFRSVHNNCINYLKKSEVLKRQYKEIADDVIYYNELIIRNYDTTIIDELIAAETEQKISHAIDELPLQARKIFLLSRFDSKSYDEIADILRISVNTVKTQMKRTLARLKEIIGENK